MTATVDERGYRQVVVDYSPTERQSAAHTSYADELLYGGAAGGGKSRFARMEALAFALQVPGSATLILRASFPDLSRAGGMIPQSLMEYPHTLGTYNATEHVWRMRNGSTIEFGHLGRDGDVTKYQGAEYQLIIIDEGTQQTEFRYRYLMSRLRASGDVKERLARLGLRPRIMMTANPGGVGHAWVKARFIDPAPPGVTWKPSATLEDPNPGTRCFIPAKVTDNPHIDESYINKLNNLDEAERRALRDGDWDVYSGQRFGSFRRAIHVIDPEEFPIPEGGSVPKAVGVDYGLDAPFSAHWGAKFGDGLIVVHRELYQAGLTPRQQAEAIRDSERPGERGPTRPLPVALDPACWARNPHAVAGVASSVDKDAPPHGSIAHAYRQVLGGAVVKAQNDRLAGVAQVADKLRVRADGLPRILIYSTCRNLIRTLPALPRSARNPEDVDTKAEDHAYDSLRYLIRELDRVTQAPAQRHSPTAGSGTPAVVSSYGGVTTDMKM